MDVEPPQITHLTVGNVTVYADNFEWLGGNKYKATGNVRFNTRVHLSGSGDYCIVDQDQGEIYGEGTVALETTQGWVEIFRDSFYVLPYVGTIHPYATTLFVLLLDEIATFEVIDTIDLYVDVINNRVHGVVTLDIDLPDNNLQATVTWEMDHLGQFSGSVSDLSLQVGGLTLKAEQISLSNDGFRVSRAHLEFPGSLGGVVSSEVYDLVIMGHAPYLELDSEFTVSNIPFGGPTGFEIQYAHLALTYRNGQFRLAGEGKFIFKNFYQYGQCALDIEFEIYSLDHWSGTLAVSCTNGVPIGSTGFFITGVYGGISFGQDNFAISLGVDIVGGPYVPWPVDAWVVSGQPTLSLTRDNQEMTLGLSGDVTILKWPIASIGVQFYKYGDKAGVQGWIEVTIYAGDAYVSGQANADIWKDSSGAHFQGNGTLTLFIPAWYFIVLPWQDIYVSLNAYVGEFPTSEGVVYGILISDVPIVGSIYVDANGSFHIGDPSSVTSQSFSQPIAAAVREITVQATKVISVDVGIAQAVHFGLIWQTGAPRLSLIAPMGRVITETTIAADVQVHKGITHTVISVRNPVTGTWQARIDNLSGGENYTLTVIQNNVPPMVTVHTPSANAEKGAGSYLIRWEATDPDDPDAQVSLYYAPGQSGPRYLITTGLPLTQTVYLWDTEAVPTGEYYIYVEVFDGVNGPRGAYSAGTVQVDNRDAPPSPVLSELTVDQEHRSCLVQWSPVSAPDLEGYRVYYGYTSGSYEHVVDAGNSTSVELLGLEEGRTLYVAVTAYDSSGNESPFSAELSKYLGAYNVFLPLIFKR